MPADAPPDAPLIVVEDIRIAYGQLGAWARRQLPAQILAVTGSAGKTTTKRLLGELLAQRGCTLVAPGTENNEIGVPRTLLDLRPEHQFGVLEFGMRGPGEIAYLAQLREVFDGLGVRPALLVPRFGATWLPPEAVELIHDAGVEAWDVIAATDAVLAKLAGTRIPPALEGELTRARAAALDGLARLGEASRVLDASLPQMVESARGKVDFQFARLQEGLTGKARARLDREHPAWRRLRYLLLPGDKLQERRVASLEPIARRGAGVASELCDLAAEHARRAAHGVHEHAVLEF